MYTVVIEYKSGIANPLYDFDSRCIELATDYTHGKFKPASDTFDVKTTTRKIAFAFKKHYNAATFCKFVTKEAERRAIELNKIEAKEDENQ